MEVLEFILATWWYACIVMFIGAVAKEKICDGSVTVKELVISVIFGLGGYLSFFFALFLTMTIFISGVGNKKLF